MTNQVIARPYMISYFPERELIRGVEIEQRMVEKLIFNRATWMIDPIEQEKCLAATVYALNMDNARELGVELIRFGLIKAFLTEAYPHFSKKIKGLMDKHYRLLCVEDRVEEPEEDS